MGFGHAFTGKSQIKYETVAASQTAQALGAAGKTGDFLERIVIIPATTTAGLVTLLDGTTSIPVYISGTLTDLKPFEVIIGAKSTTGAWSVTTGASVSVIAIGQFS